MGLTTVLASGGVAGCTSYYNGAWGLRSSDRRAAVAYKQARETQELRNISAADRSQPARQNPQLHTTGQPAGYPTAQGPTQGHAVPVQQGGPRPAHNTTGVPTQVRFVGSSPEETRRSGRPGLVSVFGSLPGVDDAAQNAGRSQTGDDHARQISFTQVGHDFDVDIDAQARRMVFASTRHRDTSDLYLQAIGGTAVTQLTSHPGQDVQPAFSPDGRSVAFASDRSGNWDLYLLPLDGGQPVQLTSDAGHDLHPSFSPDGQSLVYCSYSTTERRWELIVIDVAQPAVKRYIGPGLFPSWSPTDNRIVFQRARERGTQWFSVWTVDLVNGEPTRPTEIIASANAAIITPRWSPDGQQVVFCTVLGQQADNSARPAASDVWTMTVDGRLRTRLTQSRGANLQPRWAKDGTIYFVSNRTQGAVENIWAVKPIVQPMVQRDGDVEQPTVMVPTP